MIKAPNAILVIMDGHDETQIALRRALEIQRLGKSVHLHLVSFCWQAMSGNTSLFKLSKRQAMKSALLRMQKLWLQGQVRETGLASTYITAEAVWSSDIASWVNSIVKKKNYDLVIKSGHSPVNLLHKPLDWQLLRECQTSILLTVPREDRKASGNIIAALDLRHLDKKHEKMNRVVLDAAHNFSMMQKAKLHCIFVVEFSKALRDLDIINPIQVRKDAIEKSRDLLAKLIEHYPIPKSRVHIPLGNVGDAVAKVAAKVDADLLVLGSSAHRSPKKLLLGNTSERLLSQTPCDVLTVHP